MHSIKTGCRRVVAFAPVAALSTTLLLVTAAAWAGQQAVPREPDAAAAASDMLAGTRPLRLAQNAPAKVSYSDEQANRGEDDYEDQCLDCHGEDLRGGLLGGAQLRGVAFEEKFGNGAPASALFLFMSTQMPPNGPGRLSPETYADLMAYVLKRNGYPVGAPLPSDFEALDALVMEK
jgi:mono/diheme cytochrome c family protein